METKNTQEVQDAPEAPTETASAPLETVHNFFASVLSVLRFTCEQNGLDFAALSQVEPPSDYAPAQKILAQNVADALHTEQEEGIGISSGEDLLAARESLSGLALALATENRYQTDGQYCGKAQHLYLTNKNRIAEAFREACERKAGRMFIRVELPDFQTENPADFLTGEITICATYPRPSRFLVVDEDGGLFYHLHLAQTWEEALQASATIPTGYDTIRCIYPADPNGLVLNSVNLLSYKLGLTPELPELPEMAQTHE